jgi:hypothetical protein
LARKRNDFIAEAASAAVFAHVETGGITAQVLNDLVMLKKPVWILSQTANGATLGRGVSELKSLDEVTGVFLSAQPAPLDASAT